MLDGIIDSITGFIFQPAVATVLALIIMAIVGWKVWKA